MAQRGQEAYAGEAGKGQHGKSTGRVLWNVCAQDLFEDMEPDETNTSFSSFPSSIGDSDCGSLPSGRFSSAASGSSGSFQAGSSVGGSARGPFPWGAPPMGWIGAPPGLPPPGPPVAALPPHSAAAAAAVAGQVLDVPIPAGCLGRPPFPGQADAGAQRAALWSVADEEAMDGPICEPGTPVVLWCEAKPARQEEMAASVSACAGYFGNQEPQLVYFPTPARFIRWLFQQPRGGITPWALLVVGWREAKPCAMAVGAAKSGDCSQLRPDARRPPLPPLTGEVVGEVNVAVETMVILLEKPEQEARVALWAKAGGNRVSNLDVHVVREEMPIRSVMANLKNRFLEEEEVPRNVVSL